MNALHDAVYASAKFSSLILTLRNRAVQAEFPTVSMTAQPHPVDWNFALFCASALSASPTERSMKSVLRIATGCLTANDSDMTHRQAAAALLDRVGNRRAIELAERREHVPIEFWTSLPPVMRLETIRNRLDLSVPLSSGENLAVNSFQRDLWRNMQELDWVSISAPTSAGKSRIVREWFLESLREAEPSTVVYLAPTRALVEEVSRDFRVLTPPGVGVHVMPWDPELDASEQRALILTQERLHLIQRDRESFRIDMLFVDEAQGLGGPDRGLLLNQVIERAITDNPSAQVIFASPLSANPEALLTDAPSNARSRAMLSDTVTVNQNLLRVEGVKGKPTQRRLLLVHQGEPTEVAGFDLPHKPTHVAKRIAYVAHALGGVEGGNIIYVNTADEAERVANELTSLLPHESIDDDIDALRQLARSAVHRKFALADALPKRVAFHYGNMPLALRTEIERQFRDGKIQYLICTSTLLEGVNLPCRTIFMRNPQKGRGKPLSEFDFWNLAGRAGRWGQEFQGNIVCVDTDDSDLWPNLPSVRRRSTLSKSTQTGLKDPSVLLAYIRSGYSVALSSSPAENLFSYLATKSVSGQSIGPLLELVASSDERDEISHAIAQSIENASFPLYLIQRHAGISPIGMQRLFTRLSDETRSLSELVLPSPKAKDAKERYYAALVLIGSTMTTEFGANTTDADDDKRKWQLANLFVNWMKGMPLAALIDQRARRPIKLPKAIRDVMRDIETVVRFHAPKYLSCYSDLLTHLLGTRGESIQDIPDVTMMLELGVSRPSEIVLMTLGISRTTVVALADSIPSESWTKAEALDWLRLVATSSTQPLPALLLREVDEIIATKGRVRDS